MGEPKPIASEHPISALSRVRSFALTAPIIHHLLGGCQGTKVLFWGFARRFTPNSVNFAVLGLTLLGSAKPCAYNPM
jgi:hypothetical protein